MVAVYSVTELVHKDSRLLKSTEIEINDVVLTKYGVGIVKYIGNVGLKSNYFNFLGVELEFPNGKNNGYVKGKKFFECKTGHGIFTKPTNVRKVPSDCLYFCLKDVVLQLNEFHSERKQKEDSRSEELMQKHRKVVMGMEREMRSRDETITKLRKENDHLTDQLSRMQQNLLDLEHKLAVGHKFTSPSRHPLNSAPRTPFQHPGEMKINDITDIGLRSVGNLDSESDTSGTDPFSRSVDSKRDSKRMPHSSPHSTEFPIKNPPDTLNSSPCNTSTPSSPTPKPSFPTELGNRETPSRLSSSASDREHTPEKSSIFLLPPKNATPRIDSSARGKRAPSFSFDDSDSDFSDSFSVDNQDESPTPSAASLVSLKHKDLAFEVKEAVTGINLRDSASVKYNHFEDALKALDSHQGRPPETVESAAGDISEAPEPPSDLPPQPKKFPKRLLQGEEILVCYPEETVWWRMVVEKHRIGKKKAQCKGLELYDGMPWSDNIPLSEFFHKKQMYFCNGQIHEEEQKEKQCMSIFDVLDVMGDKELTLDEFIEGLEIFELNFSERDLKSVFLEIEGGGEVEDEDEFEDMVIDFELFLEFMTKPSAHPTAIRFKREIYRKKLPERTLVTCKDTGNKVAQSKSQQCHMCRAWVWHRVAQIHDDKYFCNDCSKNQHCEQCRKFTLSVITNEVEERLCQECYRKNYKHEVTLEFSEAPLPFDIWPNDERPMVRNIDTHMVINDINDGDTIISINDRNVQYMTASQFLDLFKDNSLQLPLTITFLSRVKKYQALRELKTYFRLANLVAYESEDESSDLETDSAE